MKNIKDTLSKIDKDHLKLLIDIGKVAEEEKQKAYLVGGMVRDLLLGHKNLDIDIVVENDAKRLAEILANKLPRCKLSAKHDRFHTAKLICNVNEKKIPFDLASTRQEIYEYPASLPAVRISDLKKDLYRRDFTINALAISLMPYDFGNVVDLFDGMLDLQNKKIKVLHELSFIDDPTRMIRAVRFATKLSFEIEEHTKSLLNEAISSGQFDNLIEKVRGDRVKIEIRYLFNLVNIKQAIDQFFNSGIYRIVSTELKSSRGKWPLTLENELPDKSHQWLILFALIIKDLNPQFQELLMKNLQMTSDEAKTIKSAFIAYNRIQMLIKDNQKIDSIIMHRELKNLSTESIVIVQDLLPDSQVLPFVLEFIETTSKIKLEITGEDLIKMGLKEGKEIGRILEKILAMKIKNPSMKKSDELQKVQDFLKVQ